MRRLLKNGVEDIVVDVNMMVIGLEEKTSWTLC
jgi:hypothetical protein